LLRVACVSPGSGPRSRDLGPLFNALTLKRFRVKVWVLMQHSQEGSMIPVPDILTTYPTEATIAALVVGVVLAKSLGRVAPVVVVALLVIGYVTGSLPW